MAKKQKTTGLARVKPYAMAQAEAPGVLGVFERLAKDRKLTVEKLGELIGLQERIMAADARSAFDAAYKVMQPAIPRITKRGVIKNREGREQSRYAKYEDIRRVVDPILMRHGFQVHFRTEWPETGTLEVVGLLTHDRGHTRESRFRTTADASGGKNAIQGLGSGVSYGKRYTLIDLLAIVCEGQDDDGHAHGKAARPGTVDTGKAIDVPSAHHAAAAEPITQKQRQRLFVIVRNSGRSEMEIKDWLAARYGLASTKDIPRDRYDEICSAVEAPGVLPAREPGE